MVSLGQDHLKINFHLGQDHYKFKVLVSICVKKKRAVGLQLKYILVTCLLQNVYAVDSQLGKRCVSGVSEWIAIVQGTADYDYSRDLTECPAAQPGQRTFTAKTTNVYVIHQAGYPQAQCTFDRQLFLCLSGGITNQQTCQFNRGQPFPCPVDGNLDPSSQTATINPPSNNVAGFGNFGGWGNFGGFPYGGGVSGFGRPSYGGFGGFASPSIGAQPFGPARFNKRK